MFVADMNATRSDIVHKTTHGPKEEDYYYYYDDEDLANEQEDRVADEGNKDEKSLLWTTSNSKAKIGIFGCVLGWSLISEF